MDMDFPDRFVVHRVSKRPPSIHAALNPDIESRDFRRSDPDLQQLKSSYDVINEKNRMLENQINEMRYQLSDSNKLLLKVQEGKNMS